MGVFSSLVATGFVFAMSRRVRLLFKKQFRIWKRASQQALLSARSATPAIRGQHTLNVAIALNGPYAYVVDMESAFINEAKYLLEREGFLLHVERSLGSADIAGEANNRAITKLLSAFQGAKPDLFVTFGSGISTYVHSHYPQYPQIFVGVTDPVASGLCDSLNPDTARGDICGTSFSLTIDDRLFLMQEAFPHKRIGFLYNPSIAADVHHLEQWRTKCKLTGITIREIPVSEPVVSEDEIERVDVIVGWLYLHEHISTFLDNIKKPIVGGGWVDLRKGACCCIGDDERDIGRLAVTNILYEHVVNRVPLSQIPIQIPTGKLTDRLLIGLNLDAAARFGISFPEKLIKLARYRVRENRK